MTLPIGTTGQRPASPIAGMLRFNSTIPQVEAYYSSAWQPLGAGITLPLGTSASATNPQRSGQAGTGFYSASSNVVSVATNGVETMEWDTTASGVNYVTVAAGATGAAPTISNGGTDTNGAGLGLDLTGASATAAGVGGPVTVKGGTGNGANLGGAVSITAGTGGATGPGATVALTGGSGGATSGAAGGVTIAGGTPVNGVGGAISISGSNGVGGSNAGGAVTITAGRSVSATSGAISTLQGGASVGGTGGVAQLVGGTGAAGTGGDAQVTGGSGGNAGNVTISGGTPTAGTGGAVTITGSDGVAGNSLGGAVTITAGASQNSGNGPAISITAGHGGSSANGGALTLAAGTGVNGGNTTISGGNSSSAAAGSITVQGGTPTSGTGGSVNITATAGVNGGNSGGNVTITSGAGGGGLGVAGNIVEQIAGTTYITIQAPSTTSSSVVFGGTTSLTLPGGTSAQRPSGVANGMLRYNSTVPQVEAYYSGAWNALGGGGGGTITLGTSASATNPQRSGQAGTGLFSATSNVVSIAENGTDVADFSSNGETILTSSAQGAGLTVNGTVWASGFTSPSDERLKKNIHTLDEALEKIEKLRGVSFDWRKPEEREIGQGMTLPTDEHQLGLIAQEVEKVFPEAVGTGNTGIKNVNYSGLVGPLIEAVKEQQREIKGQQEKIDAQQTEIDELRQNVSDLKVGGYPQTPQTQTPTDESDFPSDKNGRR